MVAKKTKKTKTKKKIKTISEAINEVHKDEKKEPKPIKRMGVIIENTNKAGCHCKGPDILAENPEASVNRCTGGRLPVSTYVGIPDDVKKLNKDLKKSKIFVDKVIKHYRELISEKKSLIEILNSENGVLRDKIKHLSSKVDRTEVLVDKFILDHFLNEDVTEEEKLEKFVEDLQGLFN